MTTSMFLKIFYICTYVMFKSSGVSIQVKLELININFTLLIAHVDSIILIPWKRNHIFLFAQYLTDEGVYKEAYVFALQTEKLAYLRLCKVTFKFSQELSSMK